MENFFSLRWREMGTRDAPPDMSSFLLLEATGDSEADLDPNSATNMELADDGDGGGGDDDDAESCVCDSSDYQSRVGSYNCVNDDVGSEQEEEEVEEGEEVEEVGRVCETWTARNEHVVGEPAVTQKSCASVDSTKKSLNDEVEKNRLFWESCLAS